MSQKELQRIKVVEKAVAGKLTVREAAELLQLSERQVTRLKQRRQPDAEEWIHHGNRGRRPANGVPEEVRQKGGGTAVRKVHRVQRFAPAGEIAAEGIVLSQPSMPRNTGRTENEGHR